MKSTMMFLIAVAGASALYAQNPLSAELKQQYNGAKRDITNAADRMPDADYSFKPAAGNTRTFGQIIGHTADIQLAVCAGAKGEQKRGNAEQTKTSKADLVAALKESFEVSGKLRALRDKFAELHAKHVEALRNDMPILARELSNDALATLAEYSKIVPKAIGYTDVGNFGSYNAGVQNVLIEMPEYHYDPGEIYAGKP